MHKISTLIFTKAQFLFLIATHTAVDLHTGGVVSGESEDCVVDVEEESGKGHGRSELTVATPLPTTPTTPTHDEEAGFRGDKVCTCTFVWVFVLESCYSHSRSAGKWQVYSTISTPYIHVLVGGSVY